MSIKVNFAAMETGAAQINTASSSIETSLADLKRYLAPLVAEWDGQAAVNYNAAQKRWDDAAIALNGILGQISQAVSVAGENYAGAEKANANIWSS